MEKLWAVLFGIFNFLKPRDPGTDPWGGVRGGAGNKGDMGSLVLVGPSASFLL